MADVSDSIALYLFKDHFGETSAWEGGEVIYDVAAQPAGRRNSAEAVPSDPSPSGDPFTTAL